MPAERQKGMAAMAITARQYAGEADYARMLAMVVESNRISAPPEYAKVGTLDWWRYTDLDPDGIYAARLWLADDDRILAIAWPSGTQVDLVTHPHHLGLEDDMLAWAETRLAETSRNDVAPWTIEVGAYSSDARRQRLLTARGYTRDGLFNNYRTRSLEVLPELRIADGYTLRNVVGEEDLELRVAAHVSAFAPSKMTVEMHRNVMASATYCHDLDLVAVAPDGTFAAYCIVWFDEFNHSAIFEPVGCHAEHRQRGLASAVMTEGLRRVKALGARSVVVMSDGTDIPANRLYESLGFTLLARYERWIKTL
jgi:mycothiol synthase